MHWLGDGGVLEETKKREDVVLKRCMCVHGMSVVETAVTLLVPSSGVFPLFISIISANHDREKEQCLKSIFTPRYAGVKYGLRQPAGGVTSGCLSR